jgi:hypothetical protein
MSTNQKNVRVLWIVFAFLLGAVLGFVAIVGVMMVLQAAISYAP